MGAADLVGDELVATDGLTTCLPGRRGRHLH